MLLTRLVASCNLHLTMHHVYDHVQVGVPEIVADYVFDDQVVSRLYPPFGM